jgi:hypothetical protein
MLEPTFLGRRIRPRSSRMTVLLENAYELETIAREIGAIFLKGHLRYPSATGGWQLGDLDLDEYLAKFRDRKLVLIVAPII